jgi:hypothetical protein
MAAYCVKYEQHANAVPGKTGACNDKAVGKYSNNSARDSGYIELQQQPHASTSIDRFTENPY